MPWARCPHVSACHIRAGRNVHQVAATCGILEGKGTAEMDYKVQASKQS